MPGHENLTVCIDFKSPNSYLAFTPTCALCKTLGVQVNWLPFLAPGMKLRQVRTEQSPGSINDGNSRGARHRHMRSEYRQRDLLRYAGNSGLSLAGMKRDIDSQLAALGLLWCKQNSTCDIKKYIETVFLDCWKLETDIANPAVIHEALLKAGAPVKGFEAFSADTGLAQLTGLHTELIECGVFDTPFYLLGGDRFLGRQHLPMIKWLLTDKQTRKPI